MIKRGRNRWNLGIMLKRFLPIFIFGRVSLHVCYLLLLHICYLLFICLYFHTCINVLFWVFQERKVHSDQDLLPFLVTFGLEVLDWNLWCICAFYGNRTVLVFEYFILYVSFVTDCQKERLLDSKSLEQMANCEYKLV